ncbi:MAG: competence/damage-inducible protein A [Armatimonadota bacterium]
MTAEVVSVGTELLLGDITDTNATYLCQRLAEAGINVYHRTTVGDNRERLCAALRQARARADVVIVTGGIGPTEDDITREAIAEVAGRPLREDPQAAQSIREFFQKRGRHLASTNIKQAMVPEGGRIIPNPHGTAPGIAIETEGTEFIALPGVPAEMRGMMQEWVLPHLQQRRGEVQELICSRTLRVTGLGESDVAERLKAILEAQTDPTIAPYAYPGEVRLRITTMAASQEQAAARLAATEAELRAALGHRVFGADEQTLESVVGALLVERGLTLSVAESCTGGLIASRVTDVPGSSRYFLGGAVTYSDAEKQRLLDVPSSMLETHGAVSEPVARAMAEGSRRSTGSDVAVAATGIAGPGGGTPEKPVGLVYIALSVEEGTACERLHLHGDRDQVKWRTSQAALDMIRMWLLGQLEVG